MEEAVLKRQLYDSNSVTFDKRQNYRYSKVSDCWELRGRWEGMEAVDFYRRSVCIDRVQTLASSILLP